MIKLVLSLKEKLDHRNLKIDLEYFKHEIRVHASVN